MSEAELKLHKVIGSMMGNIPCDFETLLQCAAETTGVPVELLKTKNRRRDIVYPRMLIIVYLRTNYNYSYDSIGKLLGGMDHATMLWWHVEYTKFIKLKDKIITNLNEKFIYLIVKSNPEHSTKMNLYKKQKIKGVVEDKDKQRKRYRKNRV